MEGICGYKCESALWPSMMMGWISGYREEQQKIYTNCEMGKLIN